MHGVTRIDVFEGVALVSFKKIPLDTGLLADIFRQFGDSGVNLDMISQTSPISDRVSVSFTCYGADMVKVLAVSKGLRESHPELLPMVSSGNGKLYLFGEEMRSTPGVFARVMDCLNRAGVEPQLVTTSEVDISLLVADARLDEAYAALKAAFAVE